MPTAMTATASPDIATQVHRIEVRPAPGRPDPVGGALLAEARRCCARVQAVRAARVYLIEAPLGPAACRRIAERLLADPVDQTAMIGAADPPADGAVLEVHYKPGVMDPVAQSTVQAIREMMPELADVDLRARTGFRYDVSGAVSADELARFADAALANPVVQDVHHRPFRPERLELGRPYALHVRHVPIRDLDDAGLARLSREGHLFLSNEEMGAIAAYYRRIGREPTDLELETFAQTWSEHCVHKTLKATIHYRTRDGHAAIPGLAPDAIAARPGHTLHADGSITIANLLKSTIGAATETLMQDPALRDWCVSVFKDNAGIVRFDDEHGIAIKVETHNHPSAIEPYGGAATGIGGCIRDVMGTGLSARPIANTDTFAVGPPDTEAVPPGVIPPRRILQQVVAGVRDYGNRMGIPTVNGSVWFDPDYLGNPLVFAGCVGILPLDCAFGEARPADHIIVLGGRTGRDGIHGATFSSAELTDGHAEEFSHAVQIGNAITEKTMLDVILAARDDPGGPLFNAITDCGAGGFSSAVGEMGADVGARVDLEAAPLKYDGLSYTEIWISEAQERMVLAVPPRHVERLVGMCDAEDVEWCRLGTFGETDEQGRPMLVLRYEGTEVGRLAMAQLHDAIPTPTRAAVWPAAAPASTGRRARHGPRPDAAAALLTLLGHPNIASKHWIVSQYDHEVQGGAVVKPLVGPGQDGPGDAAVIRPRLDTDRGIAIGSGLQPGIGEKAAPHDARQGDSYWMALAAIDEAVRNVVCVGADPARIALLDNFCWPGCDDPAQLGALVRAAEACYDGALAYRTPFVSGKDSLNNQFATEAGAVITIPPTLLITSVGIVADVLQCVTMDAKSPGDLLLLVGRTTPALGGSHYVRATGDRDVDLSIPRVDLAAHPAHARVVARLIACGLVRAAHDCSDGGLLVAAAEMAFAGRVGLDLDPGRLGPDAAGPWPAACFAETPGRYLLEVATADLARAVDILQRAGVAHAVIGNFAEHERLTLAGRIDESLETLRQAWRRTLDW